MSIGLMSGVLKKKLEVAFVCDYLFVQTCVWPSSPYSVWLPHSSFFFFGHESIQAMQIMY